MYFHCCLENYQEDNGLFPIQLCNSKLGSEMFSIIQSLNGHREKYFKIKSLMVFIIKRDANILLGMHKAFVLEDTQFWLWVNLGKHHDLICHHSQMIYMNDIRQSYDILFHTSLAVILSFSNFLSYKTDVKHFVCRSYPGIILSLTPFIGISVPKDAIS